MTYNYYLFGNYFTLRYQPIARCDYPKSCGLLMQVFDRSAQAYQDLIGTSTATATLQIQEGLYNKTSREERFNS